MIEFFDNKISSINAGRPQFSHDDLFFDATSLTNILDGQHFILDNTSTQCPSASAVSKTTMRAITELGVEDKSQTFQYLSMMNESWGRISQLPVEHLQLNTQLYQLSVYEQRYKNNLMYNSGLKITVTSPIHRSREVTRGVLSSNMSVLLFNSSFTFVHYWLKSHNKTCTPNTCSAMSNELPPTLHLQKHPAAVSFPDGLSCVITPYPKPMGISEGIEPPPFPNISPTIVQISMQKTEKGSAHEVDKGIVGTKLGMTGEIEHKISKYENYKDTLNISEGFYGSKVQISEKVKCKQLEDLYLVGRTDSNANHADLQNQSSPRGAFPMQQEIRQRKFFRNCWVNWLRRPKLRFPLVWYQLVHTKTMVIWLSYGLLLSKSTNITWFT